MRESRVFKAIENWASQDPDRVRLLIILVWVALGVVVLGSTVALALFILPKAFWAS